MKTQTDPTIAALLAHIAANCKPVDREAAFDSMLDDCYSFKAVGGPFAWMTPSAVLREMDPTAYRCGVNDYADDQEWDEVGGETYTREDIEEAKAEFIAEFETEQRAEIEEGDEEAEAALAEKLETLNDWEP